MQKYVTRELRKEEDGRTTSSSWEIVYLAAEADELIQRFRSALADIAFSADMTLEVSRNKAKRIYDETAGL